MRIESNLVGGKWGILIEKVKEKKERHSRGIRSKGERRQCIKSTSKTTYIMQHEVSWEIRYWKPGCIWIWCCDKCDAIQGLWVNNTMKFKFHKYYLRKKTQKTNTYCLRNRMGFGGKRKILGFKLGWKLLFICKIRRLLQKIYFIFQS